MLQRFIRREKGGEEGVRRREIDARCTQEEGPSEQVRSRRVRRAPSNARRAHSRVAVRVDSEARALLPTARDGSQLGFRVLLWTSNPKSPRGARGDSSERGDSGGLAWFCWCLPRREGAHSECTVTGLGAPEPLEPTARSL